MNTIKPYTYLIRFKPNGKCYYGSRFKNVKLGLTPTEDLMIKYYTSSKYIKQLIEEYGIDSFEWEVRKTFDTDTEAVNWEKRVLQKCDVLHNRDKWFNGNIAGYIIPTEESTKKISEFHKGKAKSEEHKQRISDANKGKKKSAEHIQKMSDGMKGKYAGDKNPMAGPCSEERKQNISIAKKGKPAKNKGIPMTEEQKKKLSDAMKGRKVDPEVVKRRALSQTGAKRSDETKRKISEAIKAKHKSKGETK
jgi:hypothetical protein